MKHNKRLRVGGPSYQAGPGVRVRLVKTGATTADIEFDCEIGYSVEKLVNPATIAGETNRESANATPIPLTKPVAN